MCAHNEDSNQPPHPRNLIRVFVVHMKRLCVLKVFTEDFDQTVWKRRLIWIFAGRMSKNSAFSDIVDHMSKNQAIHVY